MLVRTLVSLTVFSTTAATSTNSTFTGTSRRLIGGNAACAGGPRVRKSWESMSSSEHELYLGAVEASIAAGTHQAMAKIHVDRQSEMTAHDTCGFILWHRRYLLAYENMLRSSDPKFRCVTLPYWNIMDNYVNMADGKCSGLVGCSPILTGIGGVTDNVVTVRNYATIPRTGVCHNDRPYKEYLDDDGKSACVIRSDTRGKKLPTDASYVQLFDLIAEHHDVRDFGYSLQRQLHGQVHGLVGGTFSSNAAPADVLFYSWHATIDMLSSIWWDCHSTETTKDGARQSPLAFSNTECRATSDARAALPEMSRESEIFMATDGQKVTENQKIQVFFDDVGNAYADMIDQDYFGDYAYTYDIPSSFNEILDNHALCPG